MWSDPIDSALNEAQKLLSGQHGNLKDAPESVIRRVLTSVEQAVTAREFEKREGRLITAQDRF